MRKVVACLWLQVSLKLCISWGLVVNFFFLSIVPECLINIVLHIISLVPSLLWPFLKNMLLEQSHCQYLILHLHSLHRQQGWGSHRYSSLIATDLQPGQEEGLEQYPFLLTLTVEHPLRPFFSWHPCVPSSFPRWSPPTRCCCGLFCLFHECLSPVVEVCPY